MDSLPKLQLILHTLKLSPADLVPLAHDASNLASLKSMFLEEPTNLYPDFSKAAEEPAPFTITFAKRTAALAGLESLVSY